MTALAPETFGGRRVGAVLSACFEDAWLVGSCQIGIGEFWWVRSGGCVVCVP